LCESLPPNTKTQPRPSLLLIRQRAAFPPETRCAMPVSGAYSATCEPFRNQGCRKLTVGARDRSPVSAICSHRSATRPTSVRLRARSRTLNISPRTAFPWAAICRHQGVYGTRSAIAATVRDRTPCPMKSPSEGIADAHTLAQQSSTLSLNPSSVLDSALRPLASRSFFRLSSQARPNAGAPAL